MNAAGLNPADFTPARPWWGGDLQTIRNYALNINRALPSHAAERLEVLMDDGTGDRLVGALHLPRGGGRDRPGLAPAEPAPLPRRHRRVRAEHRPRRRRRAERP